MVRVREDTWQNLWFCELSVNFRLFSNFFLQYDPVSSGTSVAVQVCKIVGEDYNIPNIWMQILLIFDQLSLFSLTFLSCQPFVLFL